MTLLDPIKEFHFRCILRRYIVPNAWSATLVEYDIVSQGDTSSMAMLALTKCLLAYMDNEVDSSCAHEWDLITRLSIAKGQPESTEEWWKLHSQRLVKTMYTVPVSFKDFVLCKEKEALIVLDYVTCNA